MSIKRGLSTIKKHREEVERKRAEAANFTKAEWLTLKDKQSVEIRFAQELDEESPNYSPKNDLGFVAIEHAPPGKLFWKKALCTMDDEGQCYGEEMHKHLNSINDKNYKGGWKQKERLYINVIVKNEDGTEEVKVLSQGTSSKGIVPTLLEIATEDGTITNRWFKLTRNGEDQATSYTLYARKENHNVEKSVEDYELFDLNNVVRKVPYAEQASFYEADSAPHGDSDAGEVERDRPRVAASAVDPNVDW